MSESDSSNSSYESEEVSSESAATSTENSSDIDATEIAPYSFEPRSSDSGTDDHSGSEGSESDSESDRLMDTSW